MGQNGDMPGRTLSREGRDLIEAARVMTLSTARDGAPWSAPVYYLYQEKRFYFFSNPESRHIRDGVNRICAAAVFRTHENVNQLEGLQMSGPVLAQKAGIQAAAVAGVYARWFGIGFSGSDILASFQRAFHARLYAFVPDRVYHMDNRRGFGSRERIAL